MNLIDLITPAEAQAEITRRATNKPFVKAKASDGAKLAFGQSGAALATRAGVAPATSGRLARRIAESTKAKAEEPKAEPKPKGFRDEQTPLRKAAREYGSLVWHGETVEAASVLSRTFPDMTMSDALKHARVDVAAKASDTDSVYARFGCNRVR